MHIDPIIYTIQGYGEKNKKQKPVSLAADEGPYNT